MVKKSNNKTCNTVVAGQLAIIAETQQIYITSSHKQTKTFAFCQSFCLVCQQHGLRELVY
jgi:hypothetical protein